MEASWFKLNLKFFSHPKTRFMLTKHGAIGPLCILSIWGHMIEHGGHFNADDEFDLIGIAESCMTDVKTVISVVESAAKCDLIQLVENTKLTSSSLGVYTKLKVQKTIESIISVKKKTSKAGKASGAKRRANMKQTSSEHDVEQKERKILSKESILSVSESMSPSDGNGEFALYRAFANRHGFAVENATEKAEIEKLLLRNKNSKWAHQIEHAFKNLHPNFQTLLRKSPIWFLKNQFSPEIGNWENGTYERNPS